MEEEPDLDFDQIGEQIIQTDFEFVDVKPEFYHSVKNFISQTVGRSFPVEDLAEQIVNSPEIGTYIVAENEEQAENAVFAFATIRPIDPASNLAGYLVSKDPKMAELLPRTAWLINERILNLPDQLAVHLHQQLLKDLEWARAEINYAPAFEFVVIITKCFRSIDKPKKKKRRLPFEDVNMVKFEEKHLLPLAELVVTYRDQVDDPNVSDVNEFEQMLIVVKLSHYEQFAASII